MNRTSWSLPRIAAIFVLAAAAAFAAGAVVEHRPSAGRVETTFAETSAAEGSAEHEAAESGHADEDVGGVRIDAPWMVVTGCVLSVLVAAGLWRSRSRSLVLGAAAFALAFAVLDGFELVHQLRESAAALVALATAALLLHLGAGLASWRGAAA